MVVEGRRLSLEDIIDAKVQDAVKKAGLGAATRAATGGEAFSIKDVMSFISEINKLAALKQAGVPPAHDARAVAETAKASGSALNKEIPATMPRSGEVPRPGPAFSPEAVYESIVGGLDGIITMYGDIKLSEAKEKLIENKSAIVALIGQQLGGAS